MSSVPHLYTAQDLVQLSPDIFEIIIFMVEFMPYIVAFNIIVLGKNLHPLAHIQPSPN